MGMNTLLSCSPHSFLKGFSEIIKMSILETWGHRVTVTHTQQAGHSRDTSQLLKEQTLHSVS